ncbi:hypothetical protein GGR58DRAFT_520486 [Xylaria digitata]|nr:hypothetical protein GGR58DRAFT_520486 [Xylaria digitata]
MRIDAPTTVNNGQRNASKELTRDDNFLNPTNNAAWTILSTLNENDKPEIELGSYLYTEGNRKFDSTNLWAGILAGLGEFGYSHSGSRVPALMVLIDGQPNFELRTMSPLHAIINTFGFGYSIRSSLFGVIAGICNDDYVFISDAGIIGSLFVHCCCVSLEPLKILKILRAALILLPGKGSRV